MSTQRYRDKMKLSEHESSYFTGRGHSKACMTHQEIANELGISRQAVHQLERSAMFKIRKALLPMLEELNPELAARIKRLAA